MTNITPEWHSEVIGDKAATVLDGLEFDIYWSRRMILALESDESFDDPELVEHHKGRIRQARIALAALYAAEI